MRLPASPPSATPAEPTPRRPQGTSVAAPMKPPGLRITPIAGLFALAGIAAIAANRHWTGSTDGITMAWTAAAALGALGFAGILAQGVFKSMGQINTLANAVFILAMSLTSMAIVLVKGPAHNFVVTELTDRWPAAAQLLAKTDPSGPSVKAAETTHSAAKGDPVIRVYKKGGQSAGVAPKGD